MRCSVQRLQRSHKQAMIAHTDGFAPQGPIPLKLGCNFPLHMVNGLHLYRAVIPKAFMVPHIHPQHIVEHQPCNQGSTTLAAVALHTVHTNSVIGLKKSISVWKVPQNSFCLLHHWYFISVCLSVPHLFSSPSSCFCSPSTQSSPLSCTSVSCSSLLFLSLLLDP